MNFIKRLFTKSKKLNAKELDATKQEGSVFGIEIDFKYKGKVVRAWVDHLSADSKYIRIRIDETSIKFWIAQTEIIKTYRATA